MELHRDKDGDEAKDRIDWNGREFNLHRLGSIPVGEAGVTATELYRRSKELCEETFHSSDSSPRDMRNFYDAAELYVMAQKVEEYAIGTGVEELEAYLSEAS